MANIVIQIEEPKVEVSAEENVIAVIEVGVPGSQGPEGPPGDGVASAADVPFDGTTLETISQGAIEADDVQEAIDEGFTAFATTVAQLFMAIGELQQAGLAPNWDELVALEEREKYALVGGGAWTNYSSDSFVLPSQGDFADGGFDIYTETVPLWGADNGSFGSSEYLETFTIPNESNEGGDMLETATVMHGDKAFPFVELNKEGNSSEDPRMQPTDYWTPPWFLARFRFTHDPSDGTTTIWRPRHEDDEAAEGTAFGIDWMKVQEEVQGEAWPLEQGNTNPWQIGKGAGRQFISRIIVNEFDGTPKADFNPSEHMVNATTVYDPIADENWVSSGFYKIIDTQTFVENWLTDAGSVTKNASYIGTYSFGSDSINYYGGASGVDIDSHVPAIGDILRVRTAGSKDFGLGSITMEVNDFIYYDGTNWRPIYNRLGGSGGGLDTANSPTANEFARFTDSDTLEGRSVSEVLTDLSLDNVDNTSDADKPISDDTQAALDDKADASLIGANNGIAELDSSGLVPSSQLPGFVDDVIEVANYAALPGTGEVSKIYVTLDDNKQYRWSGSVYVELGSGGVALGETNATAYRGDRGKTAYDHSQLTSGNPHNVSKTDVGLGNVTNDEQVPKSLYDANSILISTADNTPVALNIPASRFLGRKATGDIVPLTAAEAELMLDQRYHIDFPLVANKADVESGDWGRFQNSGGWFGGYYSNNTTPVDGDYLEWTNLKLPAGGTWTVELLYNATSSMGIADILVNGASIGTVDMYSASSVTAIGTVSTTFSPTGGGTTIRIALNGKNGSSAGYLSRIAGLSFRRTA